MASIDKLIKLLNSSANLAENLDDETRLSIAQDVVEGYEIDLDSRKDWLEINQKALALAKTEETKSESASRDFPFDGASKVIYPLIGPAIIQLAARLSQHIVRNGRVAECTVLGQDQPQINPQTGQPTGEGVKELKAKRITDWYSYKLLVESDSWLPDQYKLCSMLVAWGIAFKETYYDESSESVVTDLISPEDVIINHNTSSLDKARRITTRIYLTKNDIITKIRSGKFLDIDLDSLDSSIMDNCREENDTRDKQPVYEILRQLCYLDLDEDEYAEPYYVFVQNHNKILLGIYPAFEISDININSKGQIISIRRRCGLVDYHLIDDPEGKYYSLGLNHVLYHLAKSLTTILRQLLDAGTLKNAGNSTGFVTKNIKTNSRTLRLKLGEFIPVDLGTLDAKISDQFYNIPFQEASQSLLALFEILSDSAKQMAFMSDLLTGDAETQNVPATTTLAMVEQATRAFKPMITKFYASSKKEFKNMFHLWAIYLNKQQYFMFQDQAQQIVQSDFDEQNMDVCPVADPTMSSEAHKYARMQALYQLFQTQIVGALNVPPMLEEYFRGLEFTSPELFIKPPAPPAPDPKMVKVQVDGQLKEKDQQIELLHTQLEAQFKNRKLDLEETKIGLKAQEVNNKTNESKSKVLKTVVDAHKDSASLELEHKFADIEQQKTHNELLKINKMPSPSHNKGV